ncbi:MAG: hypothetical protein HYT79_09285 [Elusimicrobia bacterium]|nr:hypothetical protein [Elusimicrobiota bacterium]
MLKKKNLIFLSTLFLIPALSATVQANSGYLDVVFESSARGPKLQFRPQEITALIDNDASPMQAVRAQVKGSWRSPGNKNPVLLQYTGMNINVLNSAGTQAYPGVTLRLTPNTEASILKSARPSRLSLNARHVLDGDIRLERGMQAVITIFVKLGKRTGRVILPNVAFRYW